MACWLWISRNLVGSQNWHNYYHECKISFTQPCVDEMKCTWKLLSIISRTVNETLHLIYRFTQNKFPKFGFFYLHVFVPLFCGDYNIVFDTCNNEILCFSFIHSNNANLFIHIPSILNRSLLASMALHLFGPYQLGRCIASVAAISPAIKGSPCSNTSYATPAFSLSM